MRDLWCMIRNNRIYVVWVNNEGSTYIGMLTHHRVPHCVGLEGNKFARVLPHQTHSLLDQVHLPPQPQRPTAGANTLGYHPSHRCLPLPLLCEFRLCLVAPALSHPVVEVDTLNRLAVRLCRLRSHPHRPPRETPVVETDSFGWRSHHRHQPLFCLV